jgi:anti-anti-sigma factor
MLSIQIKQQKTQLTLNMKGELTIYHVSQALSELKEIKNFTQKLICNVSDLNEIDTAGVQLVLSLMKTVGNAGGSFLINKSNAMFDELVNTFALAEELAVGKN